jgi:hypothetical protein
MDKRRLALAALLVPLLAYPVCLTIGLATDLLFGEGSAAYFWVSHSKGQVWRLFWGDWARASVAAYPLVLMVMLPSVGLLAYFRQRGRWSYLAAGTTGGLCISLLRGGAPLETLAPFALGGAVLGLATWIIVHRRRLGQADRSR